MVLGFLFETFFVAGLFFKVLKGDIAQVACVVEVVLDLELKIIRVPLEVSVLVVFHVVDRLLPKHSVIKEGQGGAQIPVGSLGLLGGKTSYKWILNSLGIDWVGHLQLGLHFYPC